MISKTTKSTSLGYRCPEVTVVKILSEGVLAASGGVMESTINDMQEWTGWEE